MQRLFLALVVSATIIATAFGQASADSANAIKLTPEQKNLAAYVGTWDLSVEGVDKKGIAVIKPILGGRFITEDVKLPFGDFDMEWHGVIGHNDAEKQYSGIWFDNANNTTQSDSGEAHESGRIITFRGEQVGHGKFIWRISNDGKNAMTIEMFQVADGGIETAVMKVLGTRRSPSAEQDVK